MVGTAERCGLPSVLENLVQELSALWERQGSNHEMFPSLASTALMSCRLHTEYSLWDAAKLSMFGAVAGDAAVSELARGQPCLTLYVGRGLQLDLSFWTTGSDAIHGHSFDGAFQVLYGRSIHVRWKYSPSNIYEDGASDGEFEPETSEILGPGDARPISASPSAIHSSYYFARPSVSLAVKALEPRAASRRPLYFQPGLCFLEPIGMQEMLKKKQLLKSLVHAGRQSEAAELLAHSVETADISETILQSLDMPTIIPERRLQSRIRTVMDRRFPGLGAKCGLVADARARSNRISTLAGSVSDPELQFFLGLMATFRGSDRVIRHIADRFPGHEPARRVAGWISDLALLREVPAVDPCSLLGAVRLLVHPQSDPTGAKEPLEGDTENRGASIAETMSDLADNWLLGAMFATGDGGQ